MNATRPAPEAAAANGRPPADLLADAFARHQAELLGTLFYLVGNIDDARDALQEAFVKCWRHREQVPEVANLRAWMFRIALNTGRDLRGAAWRRRRVPLEKDGSMLVSQAENVDSRLEQDEQLARVRGAVADLRPEEQEVFLLRQNGELTYEEISAAVGIPLSTVKTRMRLAITKLRLVLASEGGRPEEAG